MQAVSSICQVTDYADLFCELFDQVSAPEFRASGETWLVDPAVLDLSREIEGEALGATLSPAHLVGRVESAPAEERQRIRFALLRGLDAALGHANPLQADVAPAALAEYALRYAETGRFDS